MAAASRLGQVQAGANVLIKLTRTFAAQVDALRNWRLKGTQIIHVYHHRGDAGPVANGSPRGAYEKARNNLMDPTARLKPLPVARRNRSDRSRPAAPLPSRDVKSATSTAAARPELRRGTATAGSRALFQGRDSGPAADRGTPQISPTDLRRNILKRHVSVEQPEFAGQDFVVADVGDATRCLTRLADAQDEEPGCPSRVAARGQVRRLAHAAPRRRRLGHALQQERHRLHEPV